MCACGCVRVHVYEFEMDGGGVTWVGLKRVRLGNSKFRRFCFPTGQRPDQIQKIVFRVEIVSMSFLWKSSKALDSRYWSLTSTSASASGSVLALNSKWSKNRHCSVFISCFFSQHLLGRVGRYGESKFSRCQTLLFLTPPHPFRSNLGLKELTEKGQDVEKNKRIARKDFFMKLF